MKILFIGPITGTDKMYFSPPLGIHRLRSYLSRHGFEAQVVDPTIEDIPDPNDFDIIGYSVVGWSAEQSYAHAATIQKHDRRLIVFGGHEATFNWKGIVENSQADAVILGEGEVPLLHMAQQLRDGKTVSELKQEPHPGLIWVEEGQVLSSTPGRALTKEEFSDATLNLDYAGIPYPEYWARNQAEDRDEYEVNVVRLYLKNRCGFKCSFCSSVNFYEFATGETPPVLTLNPKNVADLMVQIVDEFPDTRTFFFQDDEIFAPKNFIKGLLEEIAVRPQLTGVRFIGQGRMEAIHPSLLPLMRDVGFDTVSLGLESFSERILKELAVGKLVRFDRYKEQISTLLEWGIKPHINIILTTPKARLEDVLETADACIDEITRGADVGLNLYVNSWAGSEMAAQGYESEGENILPIDVELRRVVGCVDLLYREFLRWTEKNHGAPSIRSPARSILLLTLLNLILEREGHLAECIPLLARFQVVPNISLEQQPDVIMEAFRDLHEDMEEAPVETGGMIPTNLTPALPAASALTN